MCKKVGNRKKLIQLLNACLILYVLYNIFNFNAKQQKSVPQLINQTKSSHTI